MNLQGRIICVLPVRQGVSSRGKWAVQEFVIETHDKFPKKALFEVFGEERIRRFGLQQGQEVDVSFDIESHERNGRWYTTIRAYDVRLTQPQGYAQQPQTVYANQVPPQGYQQQPPVQSTQQQVYTVPEPDPESDLPF